METLIVDGKDYAEEVVAFAQALVRTRSYSGQEEGMARTVVAKMQELGFDEAYIDRYGSVVGRVGQGERALLFDSHMDTVTVTDEELWRVPPFSGGIVDGALWGRGSVDMKSGLAASVYAAALARRRGLLEGKTVYVSGTVDEEYCDGESLGHVLEQCHPRPEFAIVCEPSSNLIATGHKGKAQVRIRTHGVSAHGSAPEKGVNAVYAMAEIIQRVEAANRRLMGQQGRHGTLVLSQISSTSVSLNAVPSACEIYLDRRMAVGETEETIQAEMDALIAGKDATWEVDHMERATWTGEQLTYRPLHPAWEISLEHELSRALIGAYQERYGHAPERFDYWDFSTNAVASVRQGIATIGFGPGAHKLAHMRDEHCPLEQIVDACAVYMGAIARL